MPDELPKGLALMEAFSADGTEGYVIVHGDGSPLTWEEAVTIIQALAAFNGTSMIAPPPIVNT